MLLLADLSLPELLTYTSSRRTYELLMAVIVLISSVRQIQLRIVTSTNHIWLRTDLNPSKIESSVPVMVMAVGRPG